MVRYLTSTLNNLIFKHPDATSSDWLKCVLNASEYERVDFYFFFL